MFRRAGPILVALALTAAAAPAQEKPAAPPPKAADAPPPPPPKPMTGDEAVAAVLDAWKAKDEMRLKGLAARKDPDSWIVADDLCAAGEHDAAEAFAKAAPGKDAERLPEYVASRRGKPEDVAARAAVRELNAALAAKNPAAALAAAEKADPDGASPVLAVRLAHGRGSALRSLRRLEESAKAFAAAAGASQGCGWMRRAAACWDECGLSAYSRSDWRTALAALEERLRVEEARGSRGEVAGALGNIGVIYEKRDEYEKALEYHGKALALTEELGFRAEAAVTLGNIGVVYQSTGMYAKALEFHEKALRVKEEVGDRAGAAATLVNMGVVYGRLGEHAKALEYLEKALKGMEEVGDRGGAASTLGNIGVVYDRLGHYAKALEYLERSLREEEEVGNRGGAATTLGNIGIVHERLGQYSKALESHEKALKLKEEVGDRAGAAATLGNIGSVYQSLGEYAKALEFHERSLKGKEEVGDRAGAATALGNIGVACESLGRYERALECDEKSLKWKEENGDLAGAVRTMGNLASLLRATRRPRDGLARARAAVALVPDLAGGLGADLGTSARSEHGVPFATGALCALDLGDPAEAAFFLESGRAGALLEAFRMRDALSGETLPRDLLRAEAASRARETRAAAAVRRAMEKGDAAGSKAAREDLESARKAMEETVLLIQRTEARAASVTYPRPDDLATIRSRLGPSEALVLYGVYEKEALALVVTAKEARLLALPPSREIRRACAALALDDASKDPAEALETLGRMVVAPLALPEGITRVLVSPDANLCFVPFSLLLTGRAVAYEPSGTVYGLLAVDKDLKGEGVLALGDPAYREGKSSGLFASLRSGWDLAPLPATRDEAKAVGTTLLLGKDATETRLKSELAKRPRWRSVHFACHGLVDMENPLRSSLSVAPDAENDGFLSVLEVFRTKLPADLVVLSACETGQGKVIRGEGIVGLTRAFMFAGAPRVLVSLWKVDDEATRALMVKFYELWNAGKGPAAALREAQAHVSGQPQWKHPKYWAAWVLWGLPE